MEFLDQPPHDDGSDSINDDCCPVCLGLWTDGAAITQAVDNACAPYGCTEANRFSMQHPPSVVIPGDVALRYHLASLEHSSGAQPMSTFLRCLKEHLKSLVLNHVKTRQKGKLQGYPPCVESEEQGFLCIHIVMTPLPATTRSPAFVLPTNTKRVRKRFRGNDPTEKQGGDPRQNLERRLRKQGMELWSCSDVETVLQGSMPPGTVEAWSEWFRTSARHVSCPAIGYNVAVWRRPFFLRGLYTKSRRDVSQTPFYVPRDENPARTKRLGVTSVEEQINPVIEKVACGGILSLNNDPDAGDTVYSMIKFHASGREDMDVRMLLPPEHVENVGGRPFVCQVIDARRLPTLDQIKQVPAAINHVQPVINSVADDDELQGRRYGRNPLGVDISPDCFAFVPSVAFKNLQSETEEKVKYYGCLCWSESKIVSEEDLNRRLGKCPLKLNQKTPIRVLHRRSSAVRVRHVLTLKPTVIDDHHFMLNLSTDAGTYVKEFVHGDLGRTIPSVSSLLGCKTDILELDCEGIAAV